MIGADFQLVPSVTPFVLSEAFLSLIIGPVGSTKTTAGIAKIAYHASRMAPCEDGVRRSRAIWVRNTREQLRDTSIKDFLQWFPDGAAGAFLKTEYAFTLRFADVECEVLFRGLDDANDVRRLLSLQASFAVLDEFREIHPDVAEALQGRLGRYPNGVMVPHRPEWGVDDKGNPVQGCVTEEGKSNRHMWGMSNPPDAETYWEELFSDPPTNTEAFLQPSGMSPEADWLHFLPSDYYETLAEGKAQDYIDVYIHAKFGRSLAGKPVFSAYSRDAHEAKEAINVMPTTLVVGVDAGLTPAAVLTQQTHDGRMLVLDELVSEDMGALRFCREKLKPLLATKYVGRSTLVVIDPAAFQRAQTDERTVADIFKQEGFKVMPARTNTLAGRLAAVEGFMTRTVDGKAAFLVSPGCTTLRQALRGRYRYRINTKGERDDKPEKNAWSHVSDALQYAALHHDGGQASGGRVLGPGKREVLPAPRRWAA